MKIALMQSSDLFEQAKAIFGSVVTHGYIVTPSTEGEDHQIVQGRLVAGRNKIRAIIRDTPDEVFTLYDLDFILVFTGDRFVRFNKGVLTSQFKIRLIIKEYL